MTGDRRDQTFDDALSAAARSLVTEPLPIGTVALTGGATAPGRTMGTGASTWWLRRTAVVGLVGALLLGVWFARDPLAPAGAPIYRDPSSIAQELRGSGYTCGFSVTPTRQPGFGSTPTPTSAPRLPDLVCGSPATLHPATGALILVLDARGGITSVHAKAGILGSPIGNANATRDSLLNRLIGVAFTDPADAALARAFLTSQLPLGAGTAAETTVHGLPVRVSRDVKGGYELQIGRAADDAPP